MKKEIESINAVSTKCCTFYTKYNYLSFCETGLSGKLKSSFTDNEKKKHSQITIYM